MDSGYRLRHLGRGALPVPPAVLASAPSTHVAGGFPLVKRNFLAENPRDVPGFARLAGVAARGRAGRAARPDPGQHRAGLTRRPDASCAAHARVDERDRPEGPPRPPWQGSGFRWCDDRAAQDRPLVGVPGRPRHPSARRLAPARCSRWCARTRPSARSCSPARAASTCDGENVVVLPLITSREGQMELARCREILLDRALRAGSPRPAASRTAHHYLHLGGGLPTRARPAVADAPRLSAPSRTSRPTTAACTRCSWPAAPTRWPGRRRPRSGLHQMWLTGLPRHDLVVGSFEALPGDLRDAEQALRDAARRATAAGAVAAAGSAPVRTCTRRGA